MQLPPDVEPTRILQPRPNYTLRTWIAALRKGNYPDSVHDYVTDLINLGYLGRITPTDKRLNKTLHFNVKKAAVVLKTLGYIGTIPFNLALLVKQVLQQSHNVAFHGKHMIKGLNSLVRSGSSNPAEQKLTFTKKNGEIIDTEMNGVQFAMKNGLDPRSRKLYTFHDLDWSDPTSVYKTLIKLGMAGYRVGDYANLVVSFNGGVSKLLAEGRAKKLSQAIKMVNSGDTSLSQYSYLPLAKPIYQHNAFGTLFGQFTSWPLKWMDMIYSWGGRTPYGKSGSVERQAEHMLKIGKNPKFLRYLAFHAGLLAALDLMGVDFGFKKLVKTTSGAFLLMTGLGPSPSLLVDTGKLIWYTGVHGLRNKESIYTNKLIAEAYRKMMRNAPLHIGLPGATSLRKIYKIREPELFSKKAEMTLGLRGSLPWYSLFTSITPKEYEEMLDKVGRTIDGDAGKW